MAFAYLVCGLDLGSSFRLGGVPEAPLRDRHEVTLEESTASELARIWSEPALPGAWQGRLRDGAELRIERGRAGDILFGYGEHARFHLDPEHRRLRCQGADVLGPAAQRVLLTRVLPLVAIARGREALHAGAVLTAAGAVAVVGASGAGKSTLVAALVGRGHVLLADDVLVLGPAAAGVLAYPASPHLSLVAGSEATGTPVAELGGKRWIAVADAAAGPAPLAAVVILERGAGRILDVSEEQASPLPLAPFMLGLPDDEGRDAGRFALYSDLAASARILRLAASPGDTAAVIAACLEEALGLPEPTLVGSGA